MQSVDSSTKLHSAFSTSVSGRPRATISRSRFSPASRVSAHCRSGIAPTWLSIEFLFFCGPAYTTMGFLTLDVHQYLRIGNNPDRACRDYEARLGSRRSPLGRI